TVLGSVGSGIALRPIGAASKNKSIPAGNHPYPFGVTFPHIVTNVPVLLPRSPQYLPGTGVFSLPHLSRLWGSQCQTVNRTGNTWKLYLRIRRTGSHRRQPRRRTLPAA